MITLPDFDRVATAEDWADTIELTDLDTGGPVDLTGYSLTLEARRLTANGVSGLELTGAAPGALAFPDGPAGGLIALTFRTPFKGKPSGRYRVTIRAENGTDTLVFLSHITVLDLDEAPA